MVSIDSKETITCRDCIHYSVKTKCELHRVKRVQKFLHELSQNPQLSSLIHCPYFGIDDGIDPRQWAKFTKRR